MMNPFQTLVFMFFAWLGGVLVALGCVAVYFAQAVLTAVYFSTAGVLAVALATALTMFYRRTQRA